MPPLLVDTLRHFSAHVLLRAPGAHNDSMVSFEDL